MKLKSRKSHLSRSPLISFVFSQEANVLKFVTTYKKNQIFNDVKKKKKKSLKLQESYLSML